MAPGASEARPSALELRGGAGDVEPGADPASVRERLSEVARAAKARRVDTLGELDAFAQVTRGSFELNGQRIQVDPGADTLDDVLERVDAAVGGVRAGYRAEQARVAFVGLGRGPSQRPSTDDSGLLDALGVLGDRREATPRRPEGIDVELQELAGALHHLVGPDNRAFLEEAAPGTAQRIRDALTQSFDSFGRAGTSPADGSDFGLRLALGEGEGDLTLEVDREALSKAAERDPKGLTEFLLGKEEADRESHGALLEVLDRALPDAPSASGLNLEEPGTLLDLQA